jgi:hypothetical protein
MGSSATVEGADALLTEGLWWPVLRRSVEVNDGRAAEAVGIRGEGRRRGSPGSWSPWADAWRSGEGFMGVREVR